MPHPCASRLARRLRTARRPLGPRRFSRRRRSLGGAPPAAAGPGLSSQRASRGRGMALALECAADRGRPPARRWTLPSASPLGAVAGRLAARPLRRRSAFRRSELHASSACFRETDRDRLLRRTCTMLPLADVMYLLTDELARLGRRGFPLACILSCPFDCFALRP